jgi:putative membrane protein
MRFLVTCLLNALAFLFTARIIDQLGVGGFEIRNLTTAAIAALILGLMNATIVPILKFLTFPLSFITLGLSSLLINILSLYSIAYYIKGFQINGIVPGVLGWLTFSLVSTILNQLFNRRPK